MNTKNKIALLIYLVLSSLFVIYIYYSSINVPVNDDFDALNFLIKFKNSPKLSDLFLQVNEHRSFTYRMLFLFFYYLFEHINFKLIIFFGAILMCALVYIILKNQKYDLGSLIIVILLLYQPSYFENLFLPEIAVVVPITYILSFIIIQKSFYIKSKNPFIFLVLTVVFFINVYSNANGMIVFLPLLYIHIKQKQYSLIIIYSCIILSYFIGFKYPEHHPSMIDSIFSYPLKTIQYFLYLISSFLNIENSYNYLFGCLIIVFYSFIIFKNINNTNKTILLFFANSIIILVVISLGRSGFGVEQALSSRYKIFSLIPFVIALLMLSSSWKKLSIILCFLISLNSWYLYVPRVKEEKLKRSLSLNNWIKANNELIKRGSTDYCLYDNSNLIYYIEDYQNYCFNTLPLSINIGIYKL